MKIALWLVRMELSSFYNYTLGLGSSRVWTHHSILVPLFLQYTKKCQQIKEYIPPPRRRNSPPPPQRLSD